MDYMLKRWEAFTRFLGEGCICLTSNAAEHALREKAGAMYSLFAIGASENAYLRLFVRGVLAISSVTGVIECIVTAANYADRTTAELMIIVPSERLARHSPVFGIDSAAQRY
jgi:hypothetical protein